MSLPPQESNPWLSPILRLFLLLIAPLILLLGIRLLLSPSSASDWWPWPLTFYDAVFFGSFCLAEAAAILIFLVVTRWAPGRIVIPSWVIFTSLVALVSLINWQRFDSRRPETWVWLGMYITAPLLGAYFWWRYHKYPPALPRRLPTFWQHWLSAQCIIIGLLGAGLLLIPGMLSRAWPWPLDSLTAQVFGAIFLANAVGAFLLLRTAAPIECAAYGLPQAILGLGAVFTLMLANAGIGQNTMLASTNLVSLLIFTAFGVSGLAYAKIR